MARVGQHFEVKVTFHDEVIFDGDSLSEAAQRFEKQVILELRELLPTDADVDIRLYGSPSAGCFSDSVTLVIQAATVMLGVAALGGNRLRVAVETAVMQVWHDNVQELSARFWPIDENPPHSSVRPDSAPSETLIRVPRGSERGVPEERDAPNSPSEKIPTPSESAAPAAALTSNENAVRLGWRDWCLLGFALVAGLAYAAERLDDRANVQEIQNRLSQIEQSVRASPPPPVVNVECPPPNVRLSCPAPTIVPREPRVYQSRGE
jgi:hypothetical protein